jgi:microcystin-dependent protein
VANGPFPPVDPNALGDVFCLSVDRLLVPYLLGVVDDLTTPGVYDGDYEDIVGTVYAFEELIQRLTLERSCMLGEVVWFATAAIPSNCLPCDGTTYNRVDYPDLYALLDDALKLTADTFKTPDLRERSPEGYHSGVNTMAQLRGAASVTLNSTNIPPHTHAIPDHNHTITDPEHSHDSPAHDHGVTDTGHLHNITHTHTFFGRTNGLVPGTSNRTAMADTSGTNSTPSTQTQSTTNSGSSTTGIDINTTAVSIDSAPTGITIDDASLTAESYGGTAGAAVAFSILSPRTVLRPAIVAR